MESVKSFLARRGIHYLATRFGWPSLKARAFDAKYRSGDWAFEDEDKPLQELLARYLKGGGLLMLGCGGAKVLSGLPAGSYSHAVGVDISTQALEIAKRVAPFNTTFCQTDMLKFKPQGRFDVILFSESLYYIKEHLQVEYLTYLNDYLSTDGVFIATFNNPLRYVGMIQNLRTKMKVLHEERFAGGARVQLVFAA